MDMVGKFATSKAGHDKGTLYVIMAQEGDFAYLSDGRLKPPDRPKKKRIKHIQLTNDTVGQDLLARLREGGSISAEEVRYARKQYLIRKSCMAMNKMEEMYVEK